MNLMTSKWIPIVEDGRSDIEYFSIEETKHIKGQITHPNWRLNIPVKMLAASVLQASIDGIDSTLFDDDIFLQVPDLIANGFPDDEKSKGDEFPIHATTLPFGISIQTGKAKSLRSNTILKSLCKSCSMSYLYTRNMLSKGMGAGHNGYSSVSGGIIISLSKFNNTVYEDLLLNTINQSTSCTKNISWNINDIGIPVGMDKAYKLEQFEDTDIVNKMIQMTSRLKLFDSYDDSCECCGRHEIDCFHKVIVQIEGQVLKIVKSRLPDIEPPEYTKGSQPSLNVGARNAPYGEYRSHPFAPVVLSESSKGNEVRVMTEISGSSESSYFFSPPWLMSVGIAQLNSNRVIKERNKEDVLVKVTTIPPESLTDNVESFDFDDEPIIIDFYSAHMKLVNCSYKLTKVDSHEMFIYKKVSDIENIYMINEICEFVRDLTKGVVVYKGKRNGDKAYHLISLFEDIKSSKMKALIGSLEDICSEPVAKIMLNEFNHDDLKLLKLNILKEFKKTVRVINKNIEDNVSSLNLLQSFNELQKCFLSTLNFLNKTEREVQPNE